MRRARGANIYYTYTTNTSTHLRRRYTSRTTMTADTSSCTVRGKTNYAECESFPSTHCLIFILHKSITGRELSTKTRSSRSFATHVCRTRVNPGMYVKRMLQRARHTSNGFSTERRQINRYRKGRRRFDLSGNLNE